MTFFYIVNKRGTLSHIADFLRGEDGKICHLRTSRTRAPQHQLDTTMEELKNQYPHRVFFSSSSNDLAVANKQAQL